MRKTNPIFCRFTAGVIFILVLSGCLSVGNSPTPRFYTLAAVGQEQAAQKFNIAPDTIIGIGPVRTPEYLNRPQMVTRDKNKMLTFAQFDRWGEPLDSALARLISEDLTVMLSGANVKIFPWNLDIPVKYQVILDVVQLESELDKDMLFVAQWSVIDLKNRKMVFIKRSEFRKPINPHNYAGLAQALSAACAELSSEIAKELAALPPPQPEK